MLVVLATLSIVGCGDGKIARYPVKGKVLVDAQPAAGAMLIFCPVSGSEEFMRERPVGIAGADGSFQLTTFVEGDGAPAGEYKILARWAGSAGQSSTAPDRLKGKYFNLEKTTLTATVDEGPTELPPFELTTK